MWNRTVSLLVVVGMVVVAVYLIVEWGRQPMVTTNLLVSRRAAQLEAIE